ncbi:TIGR00341 family protein [Candidatus Peregrinibacteria bacterium]|nr:TIGR00341 family protein [Candidatus Peregrinibacteria bacterium]
MRAKSTKNTGEDKNEKKEVTVENAEGEKEQITVEKKEVSESPLLKDQIKGGDTAQPDQIVVTKDTSFFDKLAWLKLSIEEKALITENILLDIKNSALYWSQLVISIIIATFGLLQNSVAVIIGAMLIAPLLNPIKGLAFGITTGQHNYFWKAARMLILSVIVAIFTASFFSYIVPLKIETTEILARTAPNLLDLLIAIASGTIAILSLYFKKLSENLSGVAMAAAILPPLAVVGIELSLGNMLLAGSSFFLFATNLFAILAVGVVIFLFYGFFPSQKDTKQRSIRITAVLFLFLISISFPLYSSLTKIGEKISLEKQANTIVGRLLDMKLVGANINKLQLNSFDDNVADFTGSIKVPEGISFDRRIQDEISKNLSLTFNRKILLEFDVTPIVKIESQ